jgi:hypothetical protein
MVGIAGVTETEENGGQQDEGQGGAVGDSSEVIVETEHR